MFDETTDVSGSSQLTLVIRYVHDSKIKEDFAGFWNVQKIAANILEAGVTEPSITGVVLGKVVLTICKDLGLDMTNCVSIGTDGASVLLSKDKGAVKFIKENGCPLATQSYCLSHMINLCVSSSTEIASAAFVTKTINKTCDFFQ